jgi:PilZ domain
MADLKSERRLDQRRRVFKGARIVFNNRQSTLDCTVSNLSATGALLLVQSSQYLPDDFELWISDDVRHAARLAWRRGDKVGVAWSS